MFLATASASANASSTATSTGTGNNLEEATQNANNAAQTAARYSLVPPTGPPPGQKTCDQLCLSCIDFRFVDNVTYYQNIKGNINNYDKIIAPGASLGYNGIPGYEVYVDSINATIPLSYDLHKIDEVAIFDHLDCGAFGLVYTPEQLAGDGEFNLHVENLNKAAKTILETYSFIKNVKKFIIDVNYNVIEIP
jgi:hypothetical protein